MIVALFLASARAPARNEVLDELLEGVTEIGGPGSPGDVVAFGPDAFVVIAGAGEAPVVAAAQAGRGRVMVLGHGGYLGAGALAQADTGAFYRNALRWLSGGKRKPKVSCAGDEKLAEALDELGMRASPELALKQADVLILKPHERSDEELAALHAFVAKGGAIVTADTGWGWQQIHKGKVLRRDLPVNRLLLPYGLAIGAATVGKTGGAGYLTDPRPTHWAHARVAFEGLRDGTVEPENAPRAEARVRAALAALSDHEPSMQLAMRRWIEAGDAPDALTESYAEHGWRPLGLRLSSWYAMGPFHGGKSLKEALAPEKSLSLMKLDGPGPKLDATLRGVGGRVPWKRAVTSGDGLDIDVGEVRFDQLLTAPEKEADWTSRAAAYLYRSIDSDEDVELSLRLAGADGVRLWVNGELVSDRDRATEPEALVLQLRAGRNHLLAKVRNRSGVWSFRLREASNISQETVNGAVDRAIAWLLERQLVDGSWPHQRNYGVGYSAYTVYTLLKSGVDPDHPAVRRAMEYVIANEGEYTYAESCRILALVTYDRGAALEELQDAVDRLCSWQNPNGMYGYPQHPGGGGHAPDLSNTLYATLALRAAAARGARVHPRVWHGLLEGTLRCWENQGSSKARRENPSAGFSYRPGGKASGSMTVAAISVLAVARDALGENLDRREAAEVDHAIEVALTWVERHMTWMENPGATGWHFFFLYGIERVGALLDRDIIGGVSWYWAGAEFLVEQQAKDGEWKGVGGHGSPPVDTILSLLFLNKATAPSSGKRKISGRQVLTAKGDVHVQAVGNDPLDVWITGFGEEVRAELGDPPLVRGVRWIVRDANGAERVAAEVDGNVDRRAVMQRFEARLDFERSGTYEVVARVTALEPHEEQGFEPVPVELESPPMRISLAASAAAAAGGYARDAAHNLLRGATVASSTVAGGHTADKALDADHSSRWLCNPKDAAPTWTAKLDVAVVADRLLLSHALNQKREADRPQVASAEVRVNGSLLGTIELDPDPHLKGELALPTGLSVTELELRVLTTRGGDLGAVQVGFAEVELLAD
ncbi:MAG: hypothetical protein AAF682_01315 [Planctomycetota bacterium]